MNKENTDVKPKAKNWLLKANIINHTDNLLIIIAERC